MNFKKIFLFSTFPIFLYSSEINKLVEDNINNDVSKSYELKIKESILGKKISEGDYIPSITLTGNTYKTYGSTIIDTDISHSGSASIKLNYVLFDGGKRNINIKEKETLLKISKNNKTLYDNSLIYDVLSLYIKGLKNSNSLKTLRLKEITLLKEVKRLNELLEVGLTTEENVIRIQADYFKNNNKILELENNIEEVKSNINLLSNLDIEKFNDKFIFKPISFNEQSISINNLHLANKNLEYSYKRELSNFLPTISFSSDYSYNKYVLENGSISDSSREGKAMISFSYKLFNSYKDTHNYQKKRINYISNVLNTKHNIKSKENTYKNSLRKLSFLKNKLEIAKLEKKSLQINFKNIKDKFNNQLVNNIEYLDALTALYDIFNDISNVKNDITQKELDLVLLSGNLIKDNISITQIEK